MTAAVAAVKFFAVPRMSFSLFFLAPVALAAYVSGGKTATALAVLSAVMQLGISLDTAGLHSFVPFWNAAVRLAFLLLAVWFVSEWRRRREAQSS